jgi:hypothetical protein
MGVPFAVAAGRRRRSAHGAPLAGEKVYARRPRASGLTQRQAGVPRTRAPAARTSPLHAVLHAAATPGAFAAAIFTASGNATRFFTAVSSARIEIAISGGVRLPM